MKYVSLVRDSIGAKMCPITCSKPSSQLMVYENEVAILILPFVYNLVLTTGNSIVSMSLPFSYVITMHSSIRGIDMVVCDINEGYLNNRHEKPQRA